MASVAPYMNAPQQRTPQGNTGIMGGVTARAGQTGAVTPTGRGPTSGSSGGMTGAGGPNMREPVLQPGQPATSGARMGQPAAGIPAGNRTGGFVGPQGNYGTVTPTGRGPVSGSSGGMGGPNASNPNLGPDTTHLQMGATSRMNGPQPGGQVGLPPWQPTTPPAGSPQPPPLNGNLPPGQFTGTRPTPGPQPGQWNPNMPQQQPLRPGQPASAGANHWANTNLGGNVDLFNPANLQPNSQNANWLAAALPAAQFGQNAMQYTNDFNEAQRRWDAEFGMTQGQNQYQQGLSTRQQQMAEWQAQTGANQWQQQFGHTQNMDTQGMALQNRQVNNQFTMGMDQNQATRDVASTYGNAQRYGADQQLAGERYTAQQQLAGQLGSADRYAGAQRYGSDQERIAAMHAANQGLAGTLGSAQMYSGAQRYGADQQLAGELGSANMYSNAQRYGAQLGLQGTQAMANADRFAAQQQLAGTQATVRGGIQEAGLYSNAQRHAANQQLAGTTAMANADRYGAQLGLQGTQAMANADRYGSDRTVDVAGIYGGAQRYQTDAELQMNQRMMENNVQLANINAFGRSAAPNTNWASSWS